MMNMALFEKERAITRGQMIMRSLSLVVIITVCLASLVIPAQPSLSYYINGIVMNEVGHHIPNATVILTNTMTGEDLMTHSDQIGRYIVYLSDLPSSYNVGDIVNVSAAFNTLKGYGTGEVLPGLPGSTINITIGDVSAPRIFHIPESLAPADEPIVISVDLEDDIEVSDVVLWYLNPEAPSYHPAAMELVGGNTSSGTWRVVLPETEKTGNLYYYVSANDTAGNNNQSDVYQLPIYHGKLDHFVLEAPIETTAGVGFNVTVTAQDKYENIVLNYTGEVELWTTDPHPASIASLTAHQFVLADGGDHVFHNVALCTSPSQVLGVRSVHNVSLQANGTIIVLPSEPAKIEVVPNEATITAGRFSMFNVRLLDTYGNMAPAIQELSFESISTSSSGVFSPSGALTIAAGETHVVFLYKDTNVSSHKLTIFNSLGMANVTVHIVNSSADNWLLTPMYTDIIAGGSVSFDLQLQDAFGNPVDMVVDTVVNLTSTSGSGIFTLQGETIENVLLSAGNHSVQFNYSDWNTANSPCLIQASNGTAIGDGLSLVNITSAATPSQLLVSTSINEIVAGSDVIVYVKAIDRFGNVFPDFNVPLYLNTTDPLVSNGSIVFDDPDQGSFTLRLFTAGRQLLMVECYGGTVKGETGIIVKPNNTNVLSLFMPESVTAGIPFSGVVSAFDEYGNLLTGYHGTVHFGSDDPYPAVIPIPYTFTDEDAGTHFFTDEFVLYMTPVGNITVVDASIPSTRNTKNLSVYDRTPPRAIFTMGSVTFIEGSRHEFTLNVWDDVRISNVELYYWYDNSPASEQQMTQISGDHFTGIGNYTTEIKLSEDGTLFFYFNVTDGSNIVSIYNDEGTAFSVSVEKNLYVYILILILVIATVSIIYITYRWKKTKKP